MKSANKAARRSLYLQANVVVTLNAIRLSYIACAIYMQEYTTSRAGSHAL
jgi:hypothetical protein